MFRLKISFIGFLMHLQSKFLVCLSFLEKSSKKFNSLFSV